MIGITYYYRYKYWFYLSKEHPPKAIAINHHSTNRITFYRQHRLNKYKKIYTTPLILYIRFFSEDMNGSNKFNKC